MSACAHPRCNTQIPEAQFACRGHWYQLPREHRNAINHTWHQRLRSGDAGPHRVAMADAMTWYAERVRQEETT